ncbi:MAG: ATP-binding protein [Proteobacteria bacterium]|nr:ATP-binding protein [Pseudomonadota bacterium]MDA0927778.1 ATP-binding protein [Pseudomonadota bacterium]
MRLSQVILTLWNGGLDPATAAPLRLGERRMISAIVFALIPCSLILVGGNIFITGDMARIVIISAVMLCALIALYLQAYMDMQRQAALAIIFALWFSPLLLMLNEGFSSTNWAWLLPVILLANYIMSRLAAIVFTFISVLALATIAVLTANGVVGHDIAAREHSSTVAVAGSLIFILACILGYAYRTSQLKSEEQLNRSMNKLREEVETRRTAELKALAGERAKATFLATVSHELRTPLNGVIGAGQLLATQDLDEEKKELVDIINSSGKLLMEVINNVLDLSRLDEGKLELKITPVNLLETIEVCLAPLRVMCNEKCLSLNLHIAYGAPTWVLTDGTRIQQILMNLVGNAIKFTDKGSIDVYLEGHDDGIVLRVKDTGIGIAEDKRQEIFDPFVQADSSVDRRFGGSGLGLTVVQRLTRLFRGDIELVSKVGVGSTFTLHLPAQECEAPVEKVKEGVMPELVDELKDETTKLQALVQPAPEILKEGVTVLVTDDNVVNRKVANKLLQKLGCKVIEAADGLEALHSISTGKIDIVLMDVQMPNMDGLTATSEIRKMNSPLCDTPIIGLSANAMPHDQQKMLKAGMDSYLAKPVHLDQLRSALDRVGDGGKMLS